MCGETDSNLSKSFALLKTAFLLTATPFTSERGLHIARINVL